MWVKAVITGLTLDACLFVVRFIWHLSQSKATSMAVVRAQAASVTLLYLVVFLSGFAGTVLVR
jgi:hypothetical protein